MIPAAPFLDLLQRSVLSLDQINLLLLDDAHLAINPDHPYVSIIKYDHEDLPGPRPRIVGITASVLNERCHTPQELEDSLAKLESALHSTAETSTDNLVADVYSTKPTEVIIDCEKYDDDTGLVEQFRDILSDSLAFLNDMVLPFDEECEESHPVNIPRTALTECLYVLESLGPWCCGKVAGVLAKQVMKIIAHENGEWQKRLLQLSLTQLSVIDHIMNDVFDNDIMCLEDFHRYMSPKVRQLLEILHSYKPDDNFMIIGSDGNNMLSALDSGMGDNNMEGEEEEDDDDDSFKLSDEEDEDFDEPPKLKDTEKSKSGSNNWHNNKDQKV